MEQIARVTIKLDDKESDEELVENMINAYYFTHEKLQRGIKFNLEGLNIDHAHSILSIIPIYTDFGIETRYNNEILKETATTYARLLNQFKFKNHILFSASFYKINEEDQRGDEIEFSMNLNINHKLTESDINNIGVKSQLEHQIQIHDTKESGWLFDIVSMKLGFYKTGGLKRLS